MSRYKKNEGEPREFIFEQAGALSYLVDPNTRRRITGGFHRFFIKDGAFYGRLGATEKMIVDRNGQLVE